MRRASLLALALLASACTARDTVATGNSVDPDDRDDFCEGEGSIIILGGGGDDVCAGDLAADTFERAICACDSIGTNGVLAIDSFDSDEGAYTPGQGGGDLATNGKLDANESITVGGDLVVAGAEGVLGASSIDVGGDLDDQGQLGRAQTGVTVGGDARVAGAITLTDLIVDGTLTSPAGATREVTGTLDLGAEATAPVVVTPPCACDPAETLDVAAYVEAHRQRNHDDDIGLDPSALADFAGDAELELPCGRYFLDRIQGTGNGTLTIRVTGRVALFVDQGITLQQDLDVVLEGGELDLFVAGNVNASGYISLGSPDAPSKIRTYIGGAGAFNLSADTTFGSNLYAPLVDLALSAPVALYGSAFVHRIITSNQLDVHYDRSVNRAGDGCP